MAILATGADLAIHPEIRDSLHRFRKRIFSDKLRWDVKVNNGKEADQYDRPDAVYILYLEDNEVLGCWRLLKTTSPYMLADIWPEFADGYLPSRAGCAELSRWAVDMKRLGWEGFERAAVDMFCTLAEYCLASNISELIMIQDPTVTPLTTQVFGLPHVRTKPRSAGVADAHVVSFRPAFAEQIRQAVELFDLDAPLSVGLGTMSQVVAAE